MITQIKGRLVEKSPTELVVDCNGVGYSINISLNTFSQLNDEENIKLFTHLIVKEDSHTLFGFSTKSERELFKLLISVSGVGASTARTMLSSLTPVEIISSINNEDVNSVQSIKGIGSKTAQRIILELKDKVLSLESDDTQIQRISKDADEAITALEVLGYSRKQTSKIVNQIKTENNGITVESLIKKALNEINWKEKGKTISVRINSLDTHYMYRDLVEIVEQAGDKVDTILVPKAGTASDVYMVDCLLTQIETNKKIKNKIGIECLIETALGMSNIKEIAKSSERLEALHFGVADYAASLRARTVVIGGLNPDYPGDQWHHGLSQLVMTCRAYGLRAIDGPFGDFNDPDAYIASAKRAAAIGIEGKWAIHPSQIDLANKVFSPPEAEVTKAKRILEELEKAALEGKGAAQLDGRMIDAASARMAENIVNINKLIQGK